MSAEMGKQPHGDFCYNTRMALPEWRNGIRGGLKIRFSVIESTGSIPVSGTKFVK